MTLTDEQIDRGRDAARNRAEWELGDASWADVIVHAFLHPDDDSAELARERHD